ncbi:MAG: thiamine ABC transporter substrate-binding protein, partial [Tabrizicola sp.]
TDQPELADRFLSFMLTEAFQSAIPQTNWMYPAITPAAGLPEGFDAFRPARSLLMTPEEAQVARDPALGEWRAALAK